ncbi:putative periplasmic protein, putative exported protein [Sinorhizobium fredii NGR234]|uniref:Periplasmic protein, putative exported protein n=1 Tax=Sinorhizobium fredii (strain NBRC 101917 / NGR234) TaxID=394 RepID=C3MHX4_SINFN|nr:murein L,D-transpeptidase family protein [Sinorhizobium fredii]ACP26476.1 putative periplasmic protein, putative exported protein [Sinorhizobium fredii NGR234]
MRFRNLVITTAIAAGLAGCTNETLDSVNLSSVKNKTEYQLSSKMVSKMSELGMQKTSPILLRIFKEEGTLEVWKANTSSRFQLLKSYKICAWSGKLGPKVKEGDRQAPEGFYPLYPHQMNPNSNYYLAINTGFPNAYDKANGRSGTHLMIHGACSSSGCYSMTDEQIIEIFALARDAFKGGQESVQLQAFPYRMTAENMARHRDNPNIEFWKMLKVGYDQFEVTKRPPQVNVCERKYVFNQQTDGSFNPSGQCPAMSTPPALQVAMANFEKDYQRDYQKSVKKFDGMVWYEPSEAERKAIVAEQRKGRELAYAPTGTSLDAGKLMKVSDLEKRLADQKEAEEAKQAALIQKEALEKATRAGKAVPVPQQSPIERPVQQAALQTAPAQKSFWNLFSKSEPAAPAIAQPSAAPAAAQQPAAAQEQPSTAPQQATAPAAANPQVATAPVAGGETAPAEQPPKKRPFWKIWGN